MASLFRVNDADEAIRIGGDELGDLLVLQRRAGGRERRVLTVEIGLRRRRGVQRDHAAPAEQLVERVIVTGKKDLFFVLEVVVEIALRHVEGGRDFVNARAMVPAPAKRRGRALEDLDATIGAVGVLGHQTAVFSVIPRFERSFKLL